LVGILKENSVGFDAVGDVQVPLAMAPIELGIFPHSWPVLRKANFIGVSTSISIQDGLKEVVSWYYVII
jgi:hypothetical protein